MVNTQILGISCAIKRLKQQILLASRCNLTVLIEGETGTGKELVAQSVFNNSSTYTNKLVALNCAAIPENLLESELFGYVKGAFSGAITNYPGLLIAANNGTLFLDEIGEMPLKLQAKLLRVLDSNHFRALGSIKEKQINLRVIAATNANLIKLVQAGKFRQDLYYRLNQYKIKVPALREHKTDLDLLIVHFIKLYNFENKTSIKGYAQSILKKFKYYNFPGNIRELKHLIYFACSQLILTPQIKKIQTINLPKPQITTNIQNTNIDQFAHLDLKGAVAEFEYQLVNARLNDFSRNKELTATNLGISQRTLQRKLSLF